MELKRNMLDTYFIREVEIMIYYYKTVKGTKKKEAKKNAEKISKILDPNNEAMAYNMRVILSDYFKNVCYEFYKRQMYIWVLLRYKYLKTAKVKEEDRLNMISDKYVFDEYKDDLEPGELPAVLLQTHESEKIIEMTRKINSSLQHILWKTKDTKAMGDFTSTENKDKKQ